MVEIQEQTHLKVKNSKIVTNSNHYWMQSWYNWEGNLINQDECH